MNFALTKGLAGVLASLVLLISIASSPVSADPYAFPVPVLAKRDPQLYFNNLPAPGNIKILTIDGREVVTLNINAGEAIKPWLLTNSSGEKVATGVYYYVIKSDLDGNEYTGKLIVIR